jgi:hypothetical protein
MNTGGRDSYCYYKTLLINRMQVGNKPHTRKCTHTEAALKLFSTPNRMTGSPGVLVRAFRVNSDAAHFAVGPHSAVVGREPWPWPCET